LHKVQVGIAGAVLLPVPDRERRVAPELVRDRAPPECVYRIEQIGLEQEDRERSDGWEQKAANEEELLARVGACIWGGGPGRRHQQGRVLRPGGERGANDACE